MNVAEGDFPAGSIMEQTARKSPDASAKCRKLLMLRLPGIVRFSLHRVLPAQ